MAAHVVVDDLSAPVLSDEDAHHLGSVLRLRVGEAVGVTDGRGGYLPCEWGVGATLAPAGSVVVAAVRTSPVTVGFVPVKGDRPEWVVQKLTELGVDRIVVVRSDRSVVRWDGARWSAQRARLERVARSAVMQSRQVWLPSVVGVCAVPDLVASPGVALADLDGDVLGPSVSTVLVGPEGGWSPEERSAAVAGGARVVGLGATVLRAETAAVAAGVLLTARRDGRVGDI